MPYISWVNWNLVNKLFLKKKCLEYLICITILHHFEDAKKILIN